MRRKILLSLFAFDPLIGSEPYVGWNFAMMLADDYDVHILTREYRRNLIASHLASDKFTLDGFRRALDGDADSADMELVVIGAGVDLPRAKDHARRIGLSERVAFLGAVPHSEVDRRFAENDIFLFTSVRDTTGTVLLEAMRNAKPIIALNHQGAKAMITQGGARLVEIGTL